MSQPSSPFTPRTSPPTDVNAELALTQAALDGNYPCAAPRNYPLPASVRTYLAVADVPTVNNAILYCTGVIGAATDPVTNGSTRFAIWGGHGYVETNVLDNYFLAGQAWPSDQTIKDSVYGGQVVTPSAPVPDPFPGHVDPTPAPNPPVAPAASDFAGRIAVLEAAVTILQQHDAVTWPKAGGAVGTPGGA